MKKWWPKLGGLIVLALLAGCLLRGSGDFVTDDPETFATKGTVRYISLEGGFYGIVGDTGEKYEPVNLPEEFRVDNLRVWFRARYRNDLASFRMWGKIIELLEIRKLRDR